MAPTILAASRDGALTYRELAAQCREMAKHTQRPGSLLMRAAAFDATAEDGEKPAKKLG